MEFGRFGFEVRLVNLIDRCFKVNGSKMFLSRTVGFSGVFCRGETLESWQLVHSKVDLEGGTGEINIVDLSAEFFAVGCVQFFWRNQLGKVKCENSWKLTFLKVVYGSQLLATALLALISVPSSRTTPVHFLLCGLNVNCFTEALV